MCLDLRFGGWLLLWYKFVVWCFGFGGGVGGFGDFVLEFVFFSVCCLGWMNCVDGGFGWVWILLFCFGFYFLFVLMFCFCVGFCVCVFCFFV